MNKIAITLLAGSLALGGFGLVNAGDDRYEKRDYYEGKGKRCDNKGMRGEYRLERMTEKLGLSDEQASRIKSIQEKYAPEKQALRSKMFENSQALRDAMHSGKADQPKIQQLAETMGNLKTEKILLKSKMHGEVSQVLTKEQRLKRKTMRHHGGKRHHEYKKGYDS